MNIGDVIQKLVKIQDDHGDLEVVICVKQERIGAGGVMLSEALAIVETVEIDDDCDKVVVWGTEL